jgi:hypothetical protein
MISLPQRINYAKKSGAMCSTKEFWRQIREVVASNALPD